MRKKIFKMQIYNKMLTIYFSKMFKRLWTNVFVTFLQLQLLYDNSDNYP